MLMTKGRPLSAVFQLLDLGSMQAVLSRKSADDIPEEIAEG